MLAGHPRLELLVLPQTGRNPVGLAAVLEASHLHPVDRRLARLGNEHVRLVALRHEPLARSRRPRCAHARRRVERHTPTRRMSARPRPLERRRAWQPRSPGASLPARGSRVFGRCTRTARPFGVPTRVSFCSLTSVVEVVVVVCCRLGRRLVRRRRGRRLLRWRRCLLRLLRLLAGAPGANRLGCRPRGRGLAGRALRREPADSLAATADRSGTPRPTITPHRKMTTDTTVAAMNRKTSCFPFS